MTGVQTCALPISAISTFPCMKEAPSCVYFHTADGRSSPSCRRKVSISRGHFSYTGTFCQNRTAQGAHRLSRKELRACPSVPAPAGAEHPEARRNHAPKQEKRRAEERGSEADERRRRAGPTEPGGPPPPLRGAARSAKRAGARAGGATTSLPTSTASTAYSSRAIHQTQPLGARGPEPPIPCRDTSPARTCPRDTLCTPGSFLPYPSSPRIPAFGSRGPPRGTASKAL